MSKQSKSNTRVISDNVLYFGYVSLNEISEVEQEIRREIKKILKKRSKKHFANPMGYIQVIVREVN